MTTRSDLLTVRDFFSSDEWNIIDAALSEYQDHYDTDEEAATYNTLVGRIAHLWTINTDATDWIGLLSLSIPSLFSLMRKIESQMCVAVQKSIDWQSGNTSVHFDPEAGVSVVRLHGNKIAEVGDDYLTLFDGDHQTKTTKSRLNALIKEFCNCVTDGVFQHNFQWFVMDNKVVKDFVNGYTFAWSFVLDMTLNCPTFVNTFVFLIMSRSTALGLLSNGSNGDEILAILNVIVEIESEKVVDEIASLLFDW